MDTVELTAPLLVCLIFFESFQTQCLAVTNFSLSKGQTLSSPNKFFELGFFIPNNSQNQFLGIWYKDASRKIVVWVANREKPITDANSSLILSKHGNLVILDGKGNVIWSTNTSSMVKTSSSVVGLSEKGNLVVTDNVTGKNLWQSFDTLSDCFLPGSSLTSNQTTQVKQVLTSWKSESDPSTGEYAVEISPQVPPQAFLRKNLKPYWRSGPWSKQKFIGIEEMDSFYLNAFTIEDNFEDGTVRISYDLYSNISFNYVRISPEGSLRTIGKNTGGDSIVGWEEPKHPCDFYGACGPSSVCRRHRQPMCVCFEGFEPQSNEGWKEGNWTGGCVRRKQLNCEKNGSTQLSGKGKTNKFLAMKNLKLPDLYELLPSEDAEGCFRTCLSNCSCSAYAYVQGIGCLIWTRKLVDTVEFYSGGETLFVRVLQTESGHGKLIIILAVVASVVFLGAVTVGYFFRWRPKQSDATDEHEKIMIEDTQRSRISKEQGQADLHLFDFHTILTATNHFSTANKLGQGGFGTVYKGRLPDGRNVAVKRLSSSSSQGIREFKNEAALISKLQHRNLVQLLGYCIEKEEKLLIYEFMVNKSLDTLLFDPMRKTDLDWPTRFNIIQGIARGLLYLHRDSCLRVIHRDLKVSNILLDEKMNPKISDFGLARIFQGTQSLANTNRVVGTLGYMSPEYGLRGIFSDKSDVFSFGVLLLEIVTGRRINSFNYDDQQHSLIAYAWKSWREGLNIADQTLNDSFNSLQVTRCIHISLLCIQDHAVDRPTMPQVLSALNNETELLQPKQPAFVFQNILDPNMLLHSENGFSVNEVTKTTMSGR